MSSNIQPNDLVLVVFVSDARYVDIKPGAIGTAVAVTKETNPLDPNGKYWEVSFSGSIHLCHERILRKIDGEGRQVGRWDYCVFNAPKRAPELDRARRLNV